MSDPARQEIQRVYLAPHKPTGDWTVDELFQFVNDCVKSGIPGTAKLQREERGFDFGSQFYAETRKELPSTQGPQE